MSPQPTHRLSQGTRWGAGGVVAASMAFALACGCVPQEPPTTPADPVDLEVAQGAPAQPVEQRAEGYVAFDSERTNLGLYASTAEQIRSLEVTPPVIGWFENWYGELNSQKLALCVERGAVPLVTWQPTDVSLDQIAAGEHDGYIRSYLNQLAVACPNGDVIVRFAHEMESRPIDDRTWYSWQDQDHETYRQAWTHVVELGRSANPNVRWLWSPNHSDEHSQPYYPGDEYVDYVGVTLNLPASKRAQYADFASYYAQRGVGEHLERYRKPLFISEVACAGDDPAAKVAYLQSVVDFVGNNPKICAAVFFNDNKDADRTYQISDNEDYMRVLYEGIEQHATKA